MSQRKVKCLVISKNNKITYLLGNICVLHRLAWQGERQNMNMFSSREKPVGTFFPLQLKFTRDSSVPMAFKIK